jgi:hypothetical protein
MYHFARPVTSESPPQAKAHPQQDGANLTENEEPLRVRAKHGKGCGRSLATGGGKKALGRPIYWERQPSLCRGAIEGEVRIAPVQEQGLTIGAGLGGANGVRLVGLGVYGQWQAGHGAPGAV